MVIKRIQLNVVTDSDRSVTLTLDSVLVPETKVREYYVMEYDPDQKDFRYHQSLFPSYEAALATFQERLSDLISRKD